jgi:hypothetical protein
MLAALDQDGLASREDDHDGFLRRLKHSLKLARKAYTGPVDPQLIADCDRVARAWTALAQTLRDRVDAEREATAPVRRRR